MLTWSASAPATVAEVLRDRVEALAVEARVASADIADPWLLTRLYERREFNPAWDDPERRESLLEALAGSTSHGLDPDDYHQAELTLLNKTVSDNADHLTRTEFDLLATDALARLAFHLRFGKVNPERLETSWNFTRSLEGQDPVGILDRLVRSEDPGRALAALAPREPRYAALVEALAELRETAAAGGWPTVAAGETLRPGMQGPRVAQLRRRLVADGVLAADAHEAHDTAEDAYDASLEHAVRAFQARHGLDADAIVGPRTLAALNVPVERRIDQVRVNLERARWVFRDLDSRYIISNIARFRATLIEDGEPVWSTRAVVGRPYRQTPVFRARMTYLVFNPTWTVPPGILSRDLLPEIRLDPDTLARRNMSVLDRNGRRIDPTTIDWATIPGRGFPYMLRQEPGPDNALGRVKFMFPNRHHVYMHDTPARDLFDRTERAFSSGCIRLENPMELARILLADNPAWDQAAIERTLRDGRERSVTLPRALTVLLIYATVVPEDGEVLYLADIYNRDQRLLEALDADFVFTPPEGYRDALGVSL